jgi:hypothetical protein
LCSLSFFISFFLSFSFSFSVSTYVSRLILITTYLSLHTLHNVCILFNK